MATSATSVFSSSSSSSSFTSYNLQSSSTSASAFSKSTKSAVTTTTTTAAAAASAVEDHVVVLAVPPQLPAKRRQRAHRLPSQYDNIDHVVDAGVDLADCSPSPACTLADFVALKQEETTYVRSSSTSTISASIRIDI